MTWHDISWIGLALFTAIAGAGLWFMYRWTGTLEDGEERE